MNNTEPAYFKAYLELAPNEKSNFTALLQNLETDRSLRMALYEDILSANENSLHYVFQSTRHDDVQTIARNELTKLSSKFIQADQNLFQSIFLRAASGDYGDKSEKVITNLYVLYANKQTALSYTFVLKMIGSNMSISDQVKFSKVLSSSPDALYVKWEKFKLKEKNQLIPAYINFYKKNFPLEAIDALRAMSDDFAAQYSKFLVNGIEEALANIIHQEATEQYEDIYKKIHSSVVRMLIHEIVDKNQNLSVKIGHDEEAEANISRAEQLMQKIGAFRKTLKLIAYGIGN